MDLRIKRTRLSLWNALLKLIVEQGYGALSVQDITGRANVNRTTFYRHYEDKDDLFRQGTVDLCDSIIEKMPAICDQPNEIDFTWMRSYIEKMFEYIDEKREVFRILGSSKSNPEFVRIIEDRLGTFLA
jgi:AcrR family transcriptional regulator